MQRLGRVSSEYTKSQAEYKVFKVYTTHLGVVPRLCKVLHMDSVVTSVISLCNSIYRL